MTKPPIIARPTTIIKMGNFGSSPDGNKILLTFKPDKGQDIVLSCNTNLIPELISRLMAAASEAAELENTNQPKDTRKIIETKSVPAERLRINKKSNRKVDLVFDVGGFWFSFEMDEKVLSELSTLNYHQPDTTKMED